MSIPYDMYVKVMSAIDLIGQGYTMTRACDEANVSVPAFKKYTQVDETLAATLSEAEQRSYDAQVDALLDPFHHETYGETDPAKAKIMSENIKWVVGKRDSKRFGDKVEVKHTHTVDAAITRALNAARNRVAIANDPGEVIDAEFTPIAPPASD